MNKSYFIEPEIIDSLQGRTLFYPSSGQDWNDFLKVFVGRVDEFHFCDITYQFASRRKPPFNLSSEYQLIEDRIEGPKTAGIENRDGYRWVEPAKLYQVWRHIETGRNFTIIWRRGFGQYALAEFADRSIGVFVHRGDSPGESGSNVYYFSNLVSRHEPLGHLFNKLTSKLTDISLVVSDGSNVQLNKTFLKKFHNSDVEGPDAYAQFRGKVFPVGAFEWSCVGFLPRRYGPTLVWCVKRRSHVTPLGLSPGEC